MGGLSWERRGEQSKSLTLLDSGRKTVFAKQQNKMNVRKDMKNMYFRKFSAKQVLKSRFKSSNSYNMNEVRTAQTDKINQRSGKTGG